MLCSRKSAIIRKTTTSCINKIPPPSPSTCTRHKHWSLIKPAQSTADTDIITYSCMGTCMKQTINCRWHMDFFPLERSNGEMNARPQSMPASSLLLCDLREGKVNERSVLLTLEKSCNTASTRTPQHPLLLSFYLQFSIWVNSCSHTVLPAIKHHVSFDSMLFIPNVDTKSGTIKHWRRICF